MSRKMLLCDRCGIEIGKDPIPAYQIVQGRVDPETFEEDEFCPETHVGYYCAECLAEILGRR